MKNKKYFNSDKRKNDLGEEFLEDVILNRAKGGEYTEVSEDFELKPSPILPIFCGASGDTIQFPFGVIRGVSDKDSKTYVFEFFDGELEKIRNKKSEWFSYCDEKTCDLANSFSSKPSSEFALETEKRSEDLPKTICPKVENFKNAQDMVCVKRKVSKKYNAPDMSAMKLLLEMRSEKQDGMTALTSEIRNMSNAEIEKRKAELVDEIIRGE